MTCVPLSEIQFYSFILTLQLDLFLESRSIYYNIDVDGIMEVPIIMGNESELREVFINIKNNAMDAMESDGRLSFLAWQNKGNIFIIISGYYRGYVG